MNDSDGITLGRRVKELRTLRKISTRDLAGRAGVSAGYISQIETGKANASLQTVRAIADAFGVQWIELFEAQPRHGEILRKADRPKLSATTTVRHFGITKPPVTDVEVLVSEYEPGMAVGDENYTHGDSHEIVVILKGTFLFRLLDQEFELHEGDSLDYRTSTPHMITNIGDTAGEALWVVTPPSGHPSTDPPA
jgi:DNA-binding XRE family transcriptional regulator